MTQSAMPMSVLFITHSFPSSAVHSRLPAHTRPDSAADEHVLHPEVGLGHLRDRVGSEMPLHGPVVQCVVERGHDHRLVEYEVAVPDGAGGGVDRVEEADGAVDAGVAAP